MDEFRALIDLILLLDESNPSEPGYPTNETNGQLQSLGPTPIKKFKPKSKKFPDLTSNHHAWAFLTATIGDMRQLILDPMPQNLPCDQLQSLSRVCNHPDLVVKQADQGEYCTND